MLLAEELLLLLVRKQVRRTAPGHATPAALAAAVLVELAETGQVTISDNQVTFHLGDGHPFAPALDSATVEDAILRTGDGLYPALVRRLTEQGTLTRGTRFGFRAWWVTDTPRRDALLAELTEVLANDVRPTTRTATLIGLLHALRVIGKVIPGLRPAGLFRAAWLANEMWPVNAFARTVWRCEKEGNDLPGLVISEDRWD
jgi:hypothetical protein